MAKKKKPKPFCAVTAIKAAAREHIGAPPPTRFEPDVKKKTRPKHKPTLPKMLADPDAQT
ncbi:MAG: hypothetical protein ACHP7I_01185 [Terriglobales bacterium]